ncbi:hypothetical protein ILUMI_14421, partial [Ignelater luminosus]
PIEALYPRTTEYAVVHKEDLNLDLEKFKTMPGKTNVSFSWLLKSEVPAAVDRIVPAIQDMLLSPEYYQAYNKISYLNKSWGRDNEEATLKRFIDATSLPVTRSGLWLHECGYLGASPDGLIGDYAVLEIECLYNLVVNIYHLYYHQTQEQLHLTRREKAYFMTCTPNDHEILLITKDLKWKNNLDVLKTFYLERFVPAVLGATNKAGVKQKFCAHSTDGHRPISTVHDRHVSNLELVGNSSGWSTVVGES